MNENHAKKILNEGGTAIGTMLTGFCSEEIMPPLAASGFDFVVIDTEHNPPGTETVWRLIRAARQAGVVPAVRVTNNMYPLIARTLDIGALGVMVPRVDNVEEAKQAVDAVKYPPVGNRGFGLREPSRNYQDFNVAQSIAWSNDNTLTILQVESQEALDNLDSVASLPGVDVLLIGPNDLSISLGVPGELDHPKMQAAFKRVIERCEANGVAPGVHLGSLESAVRWKEAGFRAVMCSTDSRIMTGALNSLGAALRGEKADSSPKGIY